MDNLNATRFLTVKAMLYVVERPVQLCIHRTKPIMLESRDVVGKCREVELRFESKYTT